MRKFLILIIVSLMSSSDGQYPLYPDQCVSCADGSIPLSPLSYNTVRSNVFNGTQPSNEGCTNGATVNGQVTINCGQGTTLMDCNRGLSTYYPDYSDLSNTFAWNRTTSVAEQVSIVFRFYQQINISRISLFFWNSESNSIIVPNVMMYWSNDDFITPSNEISISTNSPIRNGDRRSRLNIFNNDNGLQFQYLRMVMSFYDDSDWIFLGEVEFCGNTAPYHIIHPSTDNDVQIVSPTATMASVTCSLNVTIPSSVTVFWTHNTIITTDRNQVTTTGNTTTLVIRNLQSSDAGVYQCVFNDSTGSGWILRRNIRLIVADPQITYPPEVDIHLVTFNPLTNFIQLMCSLNVIIPSSVTAVWAYNGNLIRPHNEVTTTGSTTTLVMRDPQPSDAGVYQCAFSGLNLGRTFRLEFRNITTIVSAAGTTTVTSFITTITTTTAIPDPITSTSANIVVTDTNSTYTPNSTTTIATAISVNSPTLSTSQSADSNSSSVGVIVAIVVLVVVVFIIITVVVVGIIVVWKRKKSQQHAKPAEGIYYSTIDETTLPKSPPSKPEVVYSEVNDKQDSKEPQYMDVTGSVHSTKQADKVIMQDNPAYSVHQTKDNPATDYSIPNDQQVKMQDNPAYSVANM